MGTLWAAAAAGLVVKLWPGSSPLPLFLLFFIILAPIFSFLTHWLFVLHPRAIERKLKKEAEDGDQKVRNIRE